MAKTINLAEYRASKADGGLDIETESRTFHILPPTLWPDGFLDLARANDNVGLATMLIGGPDNYAAFVEAGGTAALLLGLIEDELGASVGE